MKNVNLTGIFLGMVDKFFISGFELGSVTPVGKKDPIDALIVFKDGNFGYIDLEAAANICETVETLVRENITGDLPKMNTTIKNGNLELYLEFKHEFIDNLS